MEFFETEAIFNYANEAILLTDSNGIIRQANPSALSLFGYEPSQMINQPVELLIPKRLVAKHLDHRTEFKKQPKARKMGEGLNLMAVKSDGTEFPVEVSLSPFVDKGERGVIAFIIDNTARRRHEMEIENQKAKLEKLADDLHTINSQLEARVKNRTLILEEAIAELNKTKEELNVALEKEKELNDMKSRFVAMASHEFRTPLATILSSLSLVTKYGEANEPEKQAKHIARIKTSINNLTDILNDVLSISKLEEGKVIPNYNDTDLKTLAAEVVQQMQSVAKEGQQLKLTYSGDAVQKTDERMIKHVLFNLISNAIKFSPEHSEVLININSGPKELLIEVTDRGIGISEEEQVHLFERFFRAQNASNIQGTGLGLNIVSKYAEMLGGTISFKSKLNFGSTFTLTIPIT